VKKIVSILAIIVIAAVSCIGGYFAYNNNLPWQQKTAGTDLSASRAATVNSYMVEIMELRNNSNEMQFKIIEMQNQIEYLISMPDGDQETVDFLYNSTINSQSQIASNSAKIVTLQSMVLDILAEQNNLIHNSIDSYKASIGTLTAEIQQMRVTIQTFTSDNENVIEAIAEFSEKINSFDIVITQIQNEITTLVARIDTADYVVASAYNLTGTEYANGWYRKWKSGWVEQGMLVLTENAEVLPEMRHAVVTLPVVMLTNTYTVTLAMERSMGGISGGSLTPESYACAVNGISKNSVQLVIKRVYNGSEIYPRIWLEVRGFAA
jgi:predicted transcriptional regulator